MAAPVCSLRRMFHVFAGNALRLVRRNRCLGCARKQAGFTLVELLAAIAILAVLGTMVTAAMVTGTRIMSATTAQANASVLVQSIDTALSDVLRYASAQVPEGSVLVDQPSFDTDSYTDVQGFAVRNGSITIDANGYLALATDAGEQSIPKAAGIYTDFIVDTLEQEYSTEENVFRITYHVVSRDGSYGRTHEFACHTMVEETTVPY